MGGRAREEVAGGAGVAGRAGRPAACAAGRLWVCATPIGNLQDVSWRLAEVLRAADLVAAEDTRRTLKLLNHLGIRKPLLSYRPQNARTRGPELVERMWKGQTVALVTDAGMPGISDPGSELVRLSADSGIAVSAVPGPSAVTAALAVSGFPADTFYFGGFLPRRSADRRRRLQELAGLPATLVFFEAPHRLAGCLADMAATLGPRPAAVARELTKAHEEVYRGRLDELAEAAASGRMTVRGEFTLVVAPPEGPRP